MIEAPGQEPASGSDPVPAADAPSPGTLLRQAREEAGLHVATLAAALKVPVRKLEALEADRFDLLPDAVFVRALAASVCRNLKLDPAPVLELLPATGAPRLAPSEMGINAPFRSPRDGAAPGWRDQLSRPVFLVVAALLLGALAVAVFPSRQEAASQSGAPLPEATPVAAAGSAEYPMPVSEPAVVSAAVAAASMPARAGVIASSTAPATAAGNAALAPAAGAASGVTGLAAVVPAAAAASAPAATGLVVFKAKAPSWIEVTDAKGGVPLRRLMGAGETAGASGPLPLAVTVGSVSATEVQVRGKPFDMAPVARDNVARFEVK